MKLPTISKESQKGFTLVELIIVIVVIGILAAIILVAYGNVTTRANASAAKSNAAAVLNYAEVYHADGNSASAYPIIASGTLPTTASATLPKAITVTATVPSADPGKDTITYLKHNDTGVCVGYWDPTTSAVVWSFGGDATKITSGACSV